MQLVSSLTGLDSVDSVWHISAYFLIDQLWPAVQLDEDVFCDVGYAVKILGQWLQLGRHNGHLQYQNSW